MVARAGGAHGAVSKAAVPGVQHPAAVYVIRAFDKEGSVGPMTQFAGKPPSQRQLRVGEEIRHVLASIFARGDLHDPDLSGESITVSEVRVSPDLKNATAFVLPLGGVHVDTVMPALKRSSPYLRHLIGQAIRLKYTPRLSFQVDHSFDEAQRIEGLLRTPAVQRDLHPDRDNAASADGPSDGPSDGPADGPGDAEDDHRGA